MYVITGASGHVGKGICGHLLAAGKQVRAIARHADKLKDLGAKGAEIRTGDLADAEFLAGAFAGAEAAFVLIPPHMQAQDQLKYADEVGEAEFTALTKAKVPYVVHLSSLGAHLDKGTGPILGLHRQEIRLNRLDANVLHLRPGYFMENLYGSVGMIKAMGANGSPLRADLKMFLIATRDIARAAADRLLAMDFKGKVIQNLLGPRDLTMAEVTAALGRAIGKPDLRYAQFPYDQAQQAMQGMGMSESVARGMVEMTRAFNEGALSGIKRDAASTTPTSIEDFAREFASAFNS